jgi:DNA-binding transcriptional MerR regulator
MFLYPGITPKKAARLEQERKYSIYAAMPDVQRGIRDSISREVLARQTLPQEGARVQQRFEEHLLQQHWRHLRGQSLPSTSVAALQGGLVPIHKGTESKSTPELVEKASGAIKARNEANGMSSAVWSAVKSAVTDKRKRTIDDEDEEELTEDGYAVEKKIVRRAEPDPYMPGPPPTELKSTFMPKAPGNPKPDELPALVSPPVKPKRKLSQTQTARLARIAKLVKEKGMTLGEASRYIREQEGKPAPAAKPKLAARVPPTPAVQLAAAPTQLASMSGAQPTTEAWGLATGSGKKAKKPRKQSDTQKKRQEMIRSAMKTRGMTLGEASSYVKKVMQSEAQMRSGTIGVGK